MIDFSLLAKPMVGAVIGYSTNWLAIKMLFKPHEAKYIGKFRIPFTPGLIPKERERIARSLGDAVGESLLTEEVISKELLDERVIEHIKTFVISGLLEQDLSIEDIMMKVLGSGYNDVVNRISETIESYLANSLKDQSVRTQISGAVKGYLTQQYPYNTKINSIVPASVMDGVEELLLSHKDQISQFLVDESRSESVVIKLKQVVSNLLLEKVGALGAMFVNPDDIATSILDYIGTTLFEEEVQKALIEGLMRGINQSSDMTLGDMIAIGQYDEIVENASLFVADNATKMLESMDFKGIINTSVRYFLGKKIHLGSRDKMKIELQVENLYRSFIENNVGTFLETFELKSIVESEVNAFSVEDIEKLIFTIVDKELKAITWFGALLGFVMGIVMIAF